MNYCRETTSIGKLSLPSDLVGLSLSFLDGRSLTSYEASSKGSRESLHHHHPDMFKNLLVQQLANVPQVKALQSKDGKRALIAWDGGDFQPVLAPRTSRAVPSPRYLHRVALAVDGWYYLHGGHLRVGMSGDVWRFRVEGPKRGSTRRGVGFSLRWEQVDGPVQQADPAAGAAGANGDDHGDGNGDMMEQEEYSNASDASGADDEDSDSDDEDDETIDPSPVIGPPPGVPDAPHSALLALAAAPHGQAAGGNPADQAALQAIQEAVGGGGEGGLQPPDIDADGNPTRPRPRCAASWTSIPGSNKIYLFGGQGAESDFLCDLWCFHAGRRGKCHWERLHAVRKVREDIDNEEGGQDEGAPAAVPEGRWGHTMVEHKGFLYMFGGSSPGQAFAGLWRLDTSTRPCVWSLLKQGSGRPPVRGGHSATIVRDTLYIFGGNIIQSVFNDLWAIDLPAGNTWRQIPTETEFPQPRIGHSAIAMGNRIIMYGGRNLETGRYASGIVCFDTELQSFINFPHTAAFAKRATQHGGMWHGLRMTGHSAVTCSRGIMFVGGLVPRGHSTMNPWVLDVIRGRRVASKKPRGGRARVLASAGGCKTS